MKVKTIAEMLAEIITGKAKPFVCTGFPIPGTHRPIEFELSLGIESYTYLCPICGFGQGGGLKREEVNALADLRVLHGSEQKVNKE